MGILRIIGQKTSNGSLKLRPEKTWYSSLRKQKILTEKPNDGKEYFFYSGFWFQVHHNGSGKSIHLTINENKIRAVSIGEIILKRQSLPHSSPYHVLFYKDGNSYNTSPQNMEWITAAEKSQRLLSVSATEKLSVQNMRKQNRNVLRIPNKMELLIKKYRNRGRSYAQISKMLNYDYRIIYRFCKRHGL